MVYSSFIVIETSLFSHDPNEFVTKYLLFAAQVSFRITGERERNICDNSTLGGELIAVAE